jgi:hypothetical protein
MQERRVAQINREFDALKYLDHAVKVMVSPKDGYEEEIMAWQYAI